MKQRNNVFFLAVLLGLLQVAAATSLAQDIEPGPGNQAGRVIFTKTIADSSAKKLEEEGVGGPYWTPNEKQVREVESRLPDHLQANAGRGHENLWLKISNYKLQIVGFTEEESKAIFVNAFCKASWDQTNHWLTELVTSKKGGDCFFQAKYDMEQNMFYDVSVNGD